MTKPDTKRAAKLSRDDLAKMANNLNDMRINSHRIYANLAPNPGVDPDLDIADAEYRAAVDAFVQEA